MRVVLVNDRGALSCLLLQEPETGSEPWGEVTADAGGALRLAIRPPAGGGGWELALEDLADALATARRLLQPAPPAEAPPP